MIFYVIKQILDEGDIHDPYKRCLGIRPSVYDKAKEQSVNREFLKDGVILRICRFYQNISYEYFILSKFEPSIFSVLMI